MRARSFFQALVLAALTLVATAAAALAAPEKVAGGIRFTYRDANAAKVAWAGAFNNWSASANPMTKGSDGVWSVVIALPAGEQQYKFVVGTDWFPDPENSATAGDFGNSVVRIGPNGDLMASAASSNTAYNAKILIGGRVIALYQSTWSDVEYPRYELERPELDMDLGFDIRMSDALNAHFLLNVNPRHEDVQDYRSRLNFKRGSMTLTQPDVKVMFFDSEVVGTWDDPLHLVGANGVYSHPFGYQRTGVRLNTPKYGFDTEVIYADNFTAGGVEFPGYAVSRGTGREFLFEADPAAATARAAALLQTTRVTGGFALVPGQFSKVSATDIGDNDRSFGFGDGDKDVFAMRVRRQVRDGISVGVLGRSDRGYHLGNMTLAEPTGDSTYSVLAGQTLQSWMGGGIEGRWAVRPGMNVEAEFLTGVHRHVFANGATRTQWKASTIASNGITATTLGSAPADGDHLTADKSQRYVLRGDWKLAEGDVVVRLGVERQNHAYAAWSQEPIAPAGSASIDHPRFENVDFQRAQYGDGSDLENSMTEWKLSWERNWRYYLGRPVQSKLDVTWTNFHYDTRTAWEHQMWFPNGNFWLESGQHVVSVARMALLGEPQAVQVSPTIEIPIRRADAMTLVLAGNYAGVRLDKKPRYAETIARFGFDWTRAIRLQTDWRWAKYDVPALRLSNGYLSQFTEAVYRFAPDVTVSLGFGVDPWVLDRNTNEYAYIGRETFLEDLNANGFIAETDWLSLAPQLSAAEKRLQNTKRIQVKGTVRF
ncbi:MAG: hypothetical protein IT348_09490 [Candidatus Eisenbacteria bacterium]|nr:hypothetical protein [Candidatus Eisenbacteria bacterium]